MRDFTKLRWNFFAICLLVPSDKTTCVNGITLKGVSYPAPADVKIVWNGDLDKFAEERDAIADVINQLPPNSRVQLFQPGISTSPPLLDFLKTKEQDTWTPKLNSITYQGRPTVSASVIGEYIRYTDRPGQYSQITLYFLSPGTELKGNQKTLDDISYRNTKLKTYVIKSFNDSLDVTLVPLATDSKHILDLSDSQDLQKLLQFDLSLRCPTDSFFTRMRCSECRSACGNLNTPEPVCGPNGNAKDECKYFLAENTATPKPKPTTTQPLVTPVRDSEGSLSTQIPILSREQQAESTFDIGLIVLVSVIVIIMVLAVVGAAVFCIRYRKPIVDWLCKTKTHPKEGPSDVESHRLNADVRKDGNADADQTTEKTSLIPNDSSVNIEIENWQAAEGMPPRQSSQSTRTLDSGTGMGDNSVGLGSPTISMPNIPAADNEGRQADTTRSTPSIPALDNRGMIGNRYPIQESSRSSSSGVGSTTSGSIPDVINGKPIMKHSDAVANGMAFDTGMQNLRADPSTAPNSEVS